MTSIGKAELRGVIRRMSMAMGIRDKPTAPASPWQNGLAERLNGSIRASVWITSLSWARSICAGFSDPMLTITTALEHIDL